MGNSCGGQSITFTIEKPMHHREYNMKQKLSYVMIHLGHYVMQLWYLEYIPDIEKHICVIVTPAYIMDLDFIITACRGSFNYQGLTLIPAAWISNYIHYKMWDEIIYPFLNFNCATVEV